MKTQPSNESENNRLASFPVRVRSKNTWLDATMHCDRIPGTQLMTNYSTVLNGEDDGEIALLDEVVFMSPIPSSTKFAYIWERDDDGSFMLSNLPRVD